MIIKINFFNYCDIPLIYQTFHFGKFTMLLVLFLVNAVILSSGQQRNLPQRPNYSEKFYADIISPFPHRILDNFTIVVRSRGNIKLKPMDALVFFVKGSTRLGLADKVEFNIGFRTTAKGTSSSFTVKSWWKEDLTYTMIVQFNKNAEGAEFWMYFLSVDNPSEYEKKLAKVDTEGEIIIDATKIQLLAPPQLNLTVKSESEQMALNALEINSMGVIECRVSGGLPEGQKATIYGVETLDVISKKYFPKSDNRLQVKFIPKAIDHDKELVCRAGDTNITKKILVFHHPSQVQTDPAFPPHRENLLPNGSSVVCNAVDGYPWPKIEWNVVLAPPNFFKFFTVTSSLRKFSLTPDAPIGSRWSINCSATNKLPSSIYTFNQTIHFTVGNSNQGLFANLIMQIIIGIAVAGAIILFSVVIVLIFCVARRGCNSRTNNRSNNASFEKDGNDYKKASDQEVTLLAKGKPMNHMNRQRDLEVEGIMPPFPSDQVGGTGGGGAASSTAAAHIVHPLEPSPITNQTATNPRQELIYAELSQPAGPSPGQNNRRNGSGGNGTGVTAYDDQVIYSQIVGTASPGAANV